MKKMKLRSMRFHTRPQKSPLVKEITEKFEGVTQNLVDQTVPEKALIDSSKSDRKDHQSGEKILGKNQEDPVDELDEILRTTVNRELSLFRDSADEDDFSAILGDLKESELTVEEEAYLEHDSSVESETKQLPLAEKANTSSKDTNGISKDQKIHLALSGNSSDSSEQAEEELEEELVLVEKAIGQSEVGPGHCEVETSNLSCMRESLSSMRDSGFVFDSDTSSDSEFEHAAQESHKCNPIEDETWDVKRSWKSIFRKKGVDTPRPSTPFPTTKGVFGSEAPATKTTHSDGTETEAETDSDSSPQRTASHSLFVDAEKVGLDESRDDYGKYFGYIDSPLESQTLSFPSDDEIDVESCESSKDNRDDVALLKRSDFESTNEARHHEPELVHGLVKRIENILRRRKRNDDEVALLSARDDTSDRNVSYNVDQVDEDTFGILNDLTETELKKTALEGENTFESEPDFDDQVLSTADNLHQDTEADEAPVWSYELQKRLELQKAYQLRLYGGRRPRVSRPPSLWTVEEVDYDEDCSYADEFLTSTGSC